MKINYDLKMQEILSSLGSDIPRLFLHTCCAPCSTRAITELANYFAITVFYYNPNIEPMEEYQKRKIEQIRFIKEYPAKHAVSFCDCDYDNHVFREAVKGLESAREGGARCQKCFSLRLERTAQIAKEKGYDYFATTLTVSPHKNSQVLNEIGKQLEKNYQIRYLYSDFKKREGYKKSIELSREYQLYRQDYCGCLFSKHNANQKLAVDPKIDPR